MSNLEVTHLLIQTITWLPSFVAAFRSRASDHQLLLKLDISPNLPPLTSNFAGLERILAELINNACKYTPAGGELILRVYSQR